MSEHTPTGVLKTFACRFCTVFGREAHDGSIKTSRRQKDDHKFTGAFRYDKYRQHAIKIHARHGKEYQRLEVEKKVQYFAKHVLYARTIYSHFGSTDFRTFTLIQDLIQTVFIPFLCNGSDLYVQTLRDPMIEGTVGLYKLAVKHGNTFDLVSGYVAAGISFLHVSTATSVSSNTGVGPRLLLSMSSLSIAKSRPSSVSTSTRSVKLSCKRRCGYIASHSNWPRTAEIHIYIFVCVRA